jgi:hypothetical protein
MPCGAGAWWARELSVEPAGFWRRSPLHPHSRFPPRRARLALAGGAGVGLLFAFGQEARGAHFISHDLASAFIVWITLV